MISKRRLWWFRFTVLVGSLAISGMAGWVIWEIHQAFAPTICDRTAAAFAAAWQSLPATSQELLDAGGYGASERLVLPANFDGCLVFSGSVVERDPLRGYRFRASQQNLWALPAGLPYQVVLPDTDSVRDALYRANGNATARERVNSLGCRGPEYGDPASYGFRVLMLGDSFTEGILVEEADTFCARLERLLGERTGRNALVVNSGVIGYSTEQEYYTLVELAGRLSPHVAVLCFYANDVHRDQHAVFQRHGAAGDWTSARRWLERCASYCRAHGVGFLVAVIPDRSQMAARSMRLRYQYRLEAIATELGIYLIDPDERFLSHRRQELWLKGDDHFAPAGHALFADVLADHVEKWLPEGDN